MKLYRMFKLAATWALGLLCIHYLQNAALMYRQHKLQAYLTLWLNNNVGCPGRRCFGGRSGVVITATIGFGFLATKTLDNGWIIRRVAGTQISEVSH